MISQKLDFSGLLLALCLWSTACSSFKSNPGGAERLFPPEEMIWPEQSLTLVEDSAFLAQLEGREKLVSNLFLSDQAAPGALAAPRGQIIPANTGRKAPSPGAVGGRPAGARARRSRAPETPNPDYKLGLGDGLELIYQFSHERKIEKYKYRIKDQIGLSFLNFPDYNRTLVVREDGKIDLPLVGEVAAADKTHEELRKVIDAAYAKLEESPQIDLYTISYTTREEELYVSMVNAELGPARRLVVRPDGYISAPVIGDVLAVGRTVQELESAIREAYKAKGLTNLTVSAMVLSTPSSVAYVMGEVMRQGPIFLRGPIDAWRAIAEAGGFSPEADRSHVVVTKSAGGDDKHFEIDFDAWREGKGYEENIVVNPGDLIYVPKVSDRYIYISGEVKIPGRIGVDVDSRITVSQAVAMGGGITDRAQRDTAMLLKKSVGAEEPKIIVVDLKAIRKMNEKGLAEEDLSNRTDPLMEPGDIVHVPVSSAGKANWFAKRWFADVIWTILPFSTSASYSYQKGRFNTSQ